MLMLSACGNGRKLLGAYEKQVFFKIEAEKTKSD